MLPEIAKPVQMSFDSKRLWLHDAELRNGGDRATPAQRQARDPGKTRTATAWPTRARCSDKLHCPTGFEFFDGGVLSVNQPRILYLKDTDGDDKADLEVSVLDGWATEDTHHTIGAWESVPRRRFTCLKGWR
jgi:hypothetical protein